MPIVIKELFPSDPLSEALEKINFNFDQLILAGGGPPGPIGPQGVPGIPGPQGERGDHWQVGTTAPTADHGPNYGSLKDFDFWISATGQVYYWNSGASAWTSSGTNLTGPQGAIGATGGSFEMGMYQGSSGNANTPGSIPSTGIGATNYTPGIGGATTVASGGVDFIIPVNIEKNSFFLGDKSWAYSKLNNFGVYDTLDPTNIQRLTPKQVIIQTEIDSTGLGGLTIGAYGATSSIGATQSLYEGDSTAITDALNFFTAGFAFNQPGGQFSHIFKMRTGTINLEIQAGDENFTGLSKGKTPDLILRSNRTLISDWQSNPRVAFGATSTMFREKVAIGYTTVPTFDVIAGATSVLDVSNHARVRGNLLIGDLSGTASKALIGYGRTIDGSSSLEFYSNGTTPTTSSFSITRNSTANGIAQIEQTGTGQLNITSTASGSFINLVGSHLVTGYIRFGNSIGSEIARIDTVNQRVGILTNNPQVALHVNGNIHVSGTDRTIFNRDAFSLAFGTNNTEWMRIIASGLIGIGTITPTDKLEIGNGNIAINDILLAVQGIGKGIKFENGTSVASSINLYRGSAANNVGLSFVNANVGATSEAMRIHPTGVISIGNSTAHGTTATIYRVHIQDNTSHSLLIRSNNAGSGSRNNILFQKQNGAGVTSPTSFIGGLSFGGWDGSIWSTGFDGGAEILAGVPSSWSGTSRPSWLSFNTTPINTISSVERMRITDAGDVGIGTTTPSSKLHVTGSLTLSGATGSVNGPQISVTSNHTVDTTNVIDIINSGTALANLFVRTDSAAGISIINNSNNGYKTLQIFGESDFSPAAMVGNQFRIVTGVANNTFAENRGNFQIGTTSGATRPPIEGYIGSAGGAIFIRSNTNTSTAGLTSFYNQLSLQVYQNFSNFIVSGVDTFYIACATNANAISQTGTNNVGVIRMGGNNVGGEGGAFRICNADCTNVLGDGGIQSAYNMEVANFAAIGFGLDQPASILTITNVNGGNEIIYGGYAGSPISSATYTALAQDGTGTYTARLAVNGITKQQGHFNTSDVRLKNELARFELGSSIEKIKKLSPVLFSWNEKSQTPGKIELGFFAQEIKEIIPEAVWIHKSENFEDEHVLEYNAIFTTAIGAIQDQQRIIESQEETIKSLEEKIARIEKLLNI